MADKRSRYVAFAIWSTSHARCSFARLEFAAPAIASLATLYVVLALRLEIIWVSLCAHTNAIYDAPLLRKPLKAMRCPCQG